MCESEMPPFGRAEAELLLERGWAQGTIVVPNGDLPAPGDGIVYVVCTQSCSVVSESLEKDPFVELAQARPLARYAPKADEARGKNVRRYHLPVEGADFPALEVDINRRSFVERRSLLAREPGKGTIFQKARRDFAAWLGRYYSRIDLPNEFVARFGTHFRAALEKFLKGASANDALRRHERIRSIYIKYKPDDELGADASYEAEFLIMCDDADVAQRMDRDLIAALGEGWMTKPGLRIKFAVNSPAETLLSDLHGFHRFTDWDHLSGPWDALADDKAT